jgi:hypothetical protein
MELRPLGFGEIFDRSVTLYIRNFLPFAAIVMVLILPTAIVQYFLDLNSQPQFDALMRIFQHPAEAGRGQVTALYNSPAGIVLLIVMLFLTYAIWPFALNAVAVGVARLYRNRPVEFRACYEAVLRRWLQIVGLLGMELLILLGWYIVTVAIVLVIVLVAALLGAASGTLSLFFAVGAVILVLLVMIPVLAPLFVALTFAMYSTVIEERGVIASLGLGFARVFNRTEFWRALLFAIAAGAVIAGASTMFSIVGMIAAFAHLPGLQAIIESLPRAFIAPFGVVLLAVYYFDVRIRQEAFDLEAGLERLTSAQPA